MKQILAQQFRNWRPKLFSDLIRDDQKLWLGTHPGDCPGIAIGHFEQPDFLSYAVLLVPKSGNNASYKLLVFSRTSRDYRFRLLDDGKSSGALSLVISKIPPDTYSDFENARTVHLKLDGLLVEWLEASSVVYYWAAGHYRTIQTTD